MGTIGAIILILVCGGLGGMLMQFLDWLFPDKPEP